MRLTTAARLVERILTDSEPRICFHPDMVHEVRAHFPLRKQRTGRRWTLRRRLVPYYVLVTTCPACPSYSCMWLPADATGYQVQLPPYLFPKEPQP